MKDTKAVSKVKKLADLAIHFGKLNSDVEAAEAAAAHSALEACPYLEAMLELAGESQKSSLGDGAGIMQTAKERYAVLLEYRRNNVDFRNFYGLGLQRMTKLFSIALKFGVSAFAILETVDIAWSCEFNECEGLHSCIDAVDDFFETYNEEAVDFTNVRSLMWHNQMDIPKTKQ